VQRSSRKLETNQRKKYEHNQFNNIEFLFRLEKIVWKFSFGKCKKHFEAPECICLVFVQALQGFARQCGSMFLLF
jgi:hypothetical protein